MSELPDGADEAIREVVEYLVAGRFDDLERDGRAGECPGDGLKREVRLYGAELVLPPVDFAERFEVFEVKTRPGTYHIDVPMWTREEGESDLTLSVDVIEEAGGAISVTICNLHVM